MSFIIILATVTILAAMTTAMTDNTSPLNANGVRLKAQDREKILVTTRPFKKNDILLIVPSEICLLAHRGGVVRGLHGQTDQLWDEVGDLREPLTDEQIMKGRTWDVQLALALLDATVGTGLAGDLWDQYASELPKPETVTLPFCFNSIEILNQLQCNSMKRNALRQQQRLRDISKEVFTDHLEHRVTAASVQRTCDSKAVPTPLQWAFAMVRSRCFKVAQDWFAIVPMIDMANHSQIPSARFEIFSGVPTDGLARSIDSNGNALDMNLDMNNDITEDTVFLLRASRDLHEGEEVTISYDQTYTNERLFVQYGFSLKGNPNDEIFITEDEDKDPGSLSLGLDSEIPITEREEDVCSGKRMAMELILSSADNVVKENGQSTVEVTSSSCDDSALRTHSTTRSLLKRLSTSSVKSTSKSEILSVTSVLSKLMEEVDILAAAYPTSLSEDKAILQSLCSSTDLLVVMTGNAVKQCSSSSGEKGESGADDPRSPIKDVDTDGVALNRCQLTACVRRRIERKELLLCAQNLLKGALSQAHT